MRRRAIIIVLLIALVLALAAGIFAATRLIAGPASLTDRTWTLTSLTFDGKTQAIVPSHPVTVRFRSQDREILGSGGCNSYDGTYLIIGDTLHISSLATTLMACVNSNPDTGAFQTDNGVMNQESAYLQAIEEVDSYHIDGGTLTLQGNGGRTTLTFSSSAG